MRETHQETTDRVMRQLRERWAEIEAEADEEPRATWDGVAFLVLFFVAMVIGSC